MSERIPARIVETIDPQRPIRLTPAQAGGTIHTRSFTGLFRSLRLGGAGLLIEDDVYAELYFGTNRRSR